LCVDLNPILTSQFYHSHFGKSFPGNRVYQWIIKSNAALRSHEEKAAPNQWPACTGFDHLAELIDATKGEPYSQLLKDLSQVNAKAESDPITSAAGVQLYRLHPTEISELKIPDDQFRWPYAPTLEISLKHLQGEEFQLITAHLLECVPLL
jgi:hypothetical protein